MKGWKRCFLVLGIGLLTPLLAGFGIGPRLFVASRIAYDNRQSGMAADNVQKAIDLLDGRADLLEDRVFRKRGKFFITEATIDGEPAVPLQVRSTISAATNRFILGDYLISLRFYLQQGENTYLLLMSLSDETPPALDTDLADQIVEVYFIVACLSAQDRCPVSLSPVTEEPVQRRVRFSRFEEEMISGEFEVTGTFFEFPEPNFSFELHLVGSFETPVYTPPPQLVVEE